MNRNTDPQTRVAREQTGKVKCCEEVREPGTWPRYHQCSKTATVKRGGKHYCGIHDPEKIKERRKKQDEEYNRKMRAERPKWFAHSMFQLLVDSQTSIDDNWKERRDEVIRKINET